MYILEASAAEDSNYFANVCVFESLAVLEQGLSENEKNNFAIKSQVKVPYLNMYDSSLHTYNTTCAEFPYLTKYFRWILYHIQIPFGRLSWV